MPLYKYKKQEDAQKYLPVSVVVKMFCLRMADRQQHLPQQALVRGEKALRMLSGEQHSAAE